MGLYQSLKNRKTRFQWPKITTALFYTPLVVLLFLGFVLKPASLSFSYASTKPAAPTYKSVSLREKYKFPKNKIDYSFNDWYFDIETSPDPRKVVGQPAKIVGFIYKQPEFKQNVFLLSRYIVTCCAVDATPIGFPIASENSSSYENGKWVQVKGTWTIMKDRNNNDRLFIIPSEITQAKEPDEPYVMSIDFYYWL